MGDSGGRDRNKKLRGDIYMTLKEFNALNLGLSEAEVLGLINQNTFEDLTLDDIYIFKVKLCDGSVDRQLDRLTDTFLQEFTEKAQNLVGLYDHNWEQVEKQQIRLFKALYIDTEEIPYSLGYAYTLQKNDHLVDGIKSGLLKEVSIGFNSTDHRCSVCGGVMECGICENGHEMGNHYDDVLCYREINHCTDALEFSLVSVPANSKASIIKSLHGGKMMKKSMFNFLKFLSSKSYTEEDREVILKAVEGAEESSEEITEEEIRALIEENAQLRSQVKELSDELDTLKSEGGAPTEEETAEETTEEKSEDEDSDDNHEEESQKSDESESDDKTDEDTKSKTKGLSVSLKPTLAKGSTVKKSTQKKHYSKGVSVSLNFK